MTRRDFFLTTLSALIGIVVGATLDKFLVPWINHIGISNDSVAIYSRIVDNRTLAILISNNSDEIIDLNKVFLDISLKNDSRLGSYIPPSSILIITSKQNMQNTSFEYKKEGRLIVTSNLTLSLKPKERDIIHLVFQEPKLKNLEITNIDFSLVDGQKLSIDGTF